MAVDGDSKSGQLVSSCVILFTVSTSFVLARFYARFTKSKTHGWDDYYLIVALVSNVVSIALIIVSCHHGYGSHLSQLDPSEAILALKASNFAVITNAICMIFLKLSIGASLLRLQLGRGMTWIVWIFIVISVCCNCLATIGSLFACVPMEAIWNKSLANYTCIPMKYVVGSSYAQAAGNIASDIFFSLGPLYYLRNVRVSVHNKWALRILFLIGLSATACSLAKLPELQKLANTTDPSYAGANITIWASAEFAAGLIATSVPPLKLWFESALKYVFGVATGSLNSSRKRAYYGGSSSVRPSRLTSRHSQHHILPDEDQVELSSVQTKTISHKTRTEISASSPWVEKRSVVEGQEGRNVV